jgi:predicted Zn-dependent protease
MDTKKGGYLLGVLSVILLLLVLGVGGWFLYQNIPGEEEDLDPIVKDNVEENVTGLSYEVEQFHPNMKFNHNALSYQIDISCSKEKREKVLESMDYIMERISVISFHSVTSDPDIEVSCSQDKIETDKDYFVAGEGGAREIVQTGRYNVITNGTILLHDNEKGRKCDWPNVEVHELMHVFGFDHSQDKNSIMYPFLDSCDQVLDQAIIDDLTYLYSQDNLVDLYFDDAKASKKGRYLDFNVSVKNSGSINAMNVDLSVFDNGEKVEVFELGNISYGAGVSLQINNLRLSRRNSENISLVLDSENLIREIDKDNNKVLL